MNGWESNTPEISSTFDQDYKSNLVEISNDHQIDINTFSHYNGDQHECFQYNDPLKYGYKHQFKPLHLNTGMDNVHFVKPHHVDSYVRKDGTFVEGYYRDGDNNTSIDRDVNHGGGYWRRD
jgi:hypothetical protein